MAISTRTTGVADVVIVSGRIDRAAGLASVLSRLIAGGRHRLAIDLSGVDFMDSSGLGELSAGLRQCQAAGGQLVLVNPSRQASEVIRLAGIEKLFRQFATETEAVTAISR
jgi:anti-sigma B factor antagonist